jgi:KipI family sensor histidine kinase inhibitor
VRFDALGAPAAAVERGIRERLDAPEADADPPPRSIDIAVRYGGQDGPDLEAVAQATGLTPDEVVAAHAGATYRVCFVGFSPGFPYLEGLPELLATPRHQLPRRRVPAGSIAIAGAQAGIYPVSTAGGWNLIGRTDLVLFDAQRNPAATLSPGDRIRFVPTGPQS